MDIRQVSRRECPSCLSFREHAGGYGGKARRGQVVKSEKGQALLGTSAPAQISLLPGREDKMAGKLLRRSVPKLSSGFQRQRSGVCAGGRLGCFVAASVVLTLAGVDEGKYLKAGSVPSRRFFLNNTLSALSSFATQPNDMAPDDFFITLNILCFTTS